jgi:mRNA-degrading endonuclease RelE of RelBE toxin-antitoxin system
MRKVQVTEEFDKNLKIILNQIYVEHNQTVVNNVILKLNRTMNRLKFFPESGKLNIDSEEVWKVNFEGNRILYVFNEDNVILIDFIDRNILKSSKYNKNGL